MVSRYDMLKFVQSISRTNLRQMDLDDILQLLKKDLPWEQLVRTAEIEGVAGLLYHHLNNLDCLDLLPKNESLALNRSASADVGNPKDICRKISRLPRNLLSVCNWLSDIRPRWRRPPPASGIVRRRRDSTMLFRSFHSERISGPDRPVSWYLEIFRGS